MRRRNNLDLNVLVEKIGARDGLPAEDAVADDNVVAEAKFDDGALTELSLAQAKTIEAIYMKLSLWSADSTQCPQSKRGCCDALPCEEPVGQQ